MLSIIAEFIDHDRLRRGPTYREISKRITTSRTTAYEHVQSLIAKGCVSGQADIARSLKLTAVGRTVIESWRDGAGWVPRPDPRADPRGEGYRTLT